MPLPRRHPFLRALAGRQGRTRNVLVNGIAPGPVETAMTEGKGYDTSLYPLKRMAKPEEVAPHAVFLCGAGSGLRLGAIFDINGATLPLTAAGADRLQDAADFARATTIRRATEKIGGALFSAICAVTSIDRRLAGTKGYPYSLARSAHQLMAPSGHQRQRTSLQNFFDGLANLTTANRAR